MTAPTFWIGGCPALHPRLVEAGARAGGICTALQTAEIMLLGAPRAVDDRPDRAGYDLLAQLDGLGAAGLGALRQVVWVVDSDAGSTLAQRNILAQTLRLGLGQAALHYAPRLRVNAIFGADLSADTLSRPLSWVLYADAVTGQLLELQGRG